MIPFSVPAVPFPVRLDETPVSDRSTPAKALESFLAAYARADAAGMRRCLMLTVPSAKTDQYVAKRGFGLAISGLKTKETANTGEIAVIDATYRWAGRDAAATVTEQVACARRDGAWKVIGGDQMIGLLAKVAGGDTAALGVFDVSRAKARAVSCLANGKQLILSTLMYCQDYDEYFPTEKWVRGTEPYYRNRGVLTCPLDRAGTVTYSINPAVVGKPMAKIALFADTVVLYEGRDRKLSFRHDGKAMVAFADGHCKMLDAREAKDLVWTLDGKPARRSTGGTERSRNRR